MKDKVKSLLMLHIMFLFYSFAGICSKLASRQHFFSRQFILYYLTVLLILIAYAFLWQQILKRMSLLIAFSNKSVTMIWGMLWGSILFGESIEVKNMIGAVVIMFGIYMVMSDSEKN